MARASVQVASLHIYPIKSCRGIDLLSAEVHASGFSWDRTWMLVDPEGTFLSQRRVPRLATIEVVLGREALRISAPDLEDLEVPLEPVGEPSLTVAIWNDRVPAHAVGREADAWFQEALGVPCRLVRQPVTASRPVDPHFGAPDDVVSLADAYPILLTSTASLTDLNSRLKDPVPMNRFRPNIVVRGASPYAEDAWKTVTGPDLTLRLVKPCARCQIITKDQRTGLGSEEPLRTLRTYRQRDHKATFGQNAIPDAQGSIRVDEILTVA
jgi:uncharacterized protein YcbX